MCLYSYECVWHFGKVASPWQLTFCFVVVRTLFVYRRIYSASNPYFDEYIFLSVRHWNHFARSPVCDSKLVNCLNRIIYWMPNNKRNRKHNAEEEEEENKLNVYISNIMVFVDSFSFVVPFRTCSAAQLEKSLTLMPLFIMYLYAILRVCVSCSPYPWISLYMVYAQWEWACVLMSTVSACTGHLQLAHNGIHSEPWHTHTQLLNILIVLIFFSFSLSLYSSTLSLRFSFSFHIFNS